MSDHAMITRFARHRESGMAASGPRVSELCDELNLSLRDLYGWAADGSIRLIDDGDVIRVHADDARRLRDSNAHR